MKTDELIDSLSRDVPPVTRHAVFSRLAGGIGAGAVLSFLAMWTWLGIRPDLASAAATSPYWIKFSYTLALALFGLWTTERLSRPAASCATPAFGALIALGILFAMAAAQLMGAAPAARAHLIMGSSADVCSWRIIILSLPICAGTLWSLRALAPTRLIVAGAVAGFGSGALGAWIYAFHCDESAMPFVFIFYTLGIALVGALGAVLARRILRW
ncbi:MAG: NrsF family protein [Rhizomicrobium sp.]